MRPARAAAMLIAIGLVLPVVALAGFVQAAWLFDAPRFETLGVVRGSVTRVEWVRVNRGSPYARLVLADGTTLFVRRPSRVSGGREALERLAGDGPNGVWQLQRGRETLLDFADTLGSLDAERRRLRVVWALALLLGLAALAGGLRLRARRRVSP